MHPSLAGERFSSTALSTRQESVRAARRWPRCSIPGCASARLRRRSSLPESADGRAPAEDRFEPAHPTGGGTFRAREVATTLGRPCQGSTGFGRKNAWAELGDYKRQGSDTPEQIGQQASVNFPNFPAVYFSTIIYFHIHVEISIDFSRIFPQSTTAGVRIGKYAICSVAGPPRFDGKRIKDE